MTQTALNGEGNIRKGRKERLEERDDTYQNSASIYSGDYRFPLYISLN